MAGRDSVSSVAALRTAMLGRADAMFGPGYVWLVAQHTRDGSRRPITELALLTTYLAGSPYPAAHFRRQPQDTATARTDVHAWDQGAAGYQRRHSLESRMEQERAAAQGFGRPPPADVYQHGSMYRNVTETADREGIVGPAGADLEPLLCVSTWPHVYLWDYGPWGKDKFVTRWWDHVDWNKVHRQFVAALGHGQWQRESHESRVERRADRYQTKARRMHGYSNPE